MILTLGCGKFRFYDHDYGMLPNTQLPRLVSPPGARCTLCPVPAGPGWAGPVRDSR